MIRRLIWLTIPALLLCVCAKADVYSFTYSGGSGPGAVFGSGFFTTGTPYGDGYVPIISITGTTEAGAITGLVGTGTDPGPLGDTPPGGTYLNVDGFNYDNAFLPGSSKPFTSSGGLLFAVADDVDSPINLFGDGYGNTYEFSYGEDSVGPAPSYGGTLITFSATLTPEPSFYAVLAIGLAGLAFFVNRRRRNACL
jgi:hypothetical protein